MRVNLNPKNLAPGSIAVYMKMRCLRVQLLIHVPSRQTTRR
jgi:hypothetical protein